MPMELNPKTWNLRTKIIVCVFLALLFTLGGFFYIDQKARCKRLLERFQWCSVQLSNAIKGSLEYAMEKSRNDEIQKMVEIVGAEKEIEEVVILDKYGKIINASKREKIGKRLDIGHYTCQVCHAEKPAPKSQMAVFRLQEGDREILRNVNPIYNDGDKCKRCHLKEGPILGILVVDTSLASYEEAILSSRNRLLVALFITFLLTGFIMALFFLHFVDRPIRKLKEAMDKVAAGDLTVRAEFTRHDELGTLAWNFNQMVSKIEDTSQEKDRWYSEAKKLNEELERRIEEAVRECRLANERLMAMNRQLEEAYQELRETQGQIIQSEKLAALGQLAAGIAHEINNPLAGILTYAKLILKKIDGETVKLKPALLRKYVSVIETETERCKNRIQALLDYARVKEPLFISTEVNQVLEDTVTLIEEQARLQKVKLVKKLRSSLPAISADPTQLKQVFLNVLMNALQAMPKGGSLQLITDVISHDNGGVEIKIIDTGQGIEEAVLPHVFEPFFSTKKDGEGTGLGLALAAKFVDNHRGSIDIKSKVGEGTEVTIRLPLSSTVR